MLTRLNTLLSVGWKVGLLAAVCAAGAVGYVGYDGARDRVAETFGPGVEAGREWSGRAGERAADLGDRGLSLAERHPYLVGSHLLGAGMFLLMVRHYLRKGFSLRKSVGSAITKLPPEEPAPPAPLPEPPRAAEERARNKLLARQLTDDRVEIERRLKRADEDIQAARNNAARTAEERAVAAQRLDDKIDADTKARARLARALQQKQDDEQELAEITADIERLKPLT